MSDSKSAGEKLIASNPKAHSNYLIQEVVEAGIMLRGTEVKSLRNHTPNIKESFVMVDRSSRKLEAWLYNAHIGPYSHGNIWNHESLRKRKLLLHRNQIEQIFVAITQKGLNAIPLRLYFKKGIAKVEIGLGRGKKKQDKRQSLKERDDQREMDRARKSHSTRGN